MTMRFKLATLLVVASCLPAIAQPASPHLPQGYFAVVRGLAHVEEGALGTYIHIEAPYLRRKIDGYIPFGDESTFGDLANIEGRTVEIGGVVALDGLPYITMTDPRQLAIVR
jgi:hypothetical protein